MYCTTTNRLPLPSHVVYTSWKLLELPTLCYYCLFVFMKFTNLGAYMHFILPIRYEGSLLSHELYTTGLFFDKKP